MQLLAKRLKEETTGQQGGFVYFEVHATFA
jgi:hypothetical protein